MRMTTDEIKLVTFVLMALLIGALTKRYHTLHPGEMFSTPRPEQHHGFPSSRRW